MAKVGESLEKIYKSLDRLHNFLDTTPHITTYKLFGIDVVSEVYGMCHWYKIKFLKDGKEVYRLVRDRQNRLDPNATRREYLFGKKFQQYDGKQNCFIEYLGLLARGMNFDVPEEMARALRVKKEVIERYNQFLKKLLIEK